LAPQPSTGTTIVSPVWAASSAWRSEQESPPEHSPSAGARSAAVFTVTESAAATGAQTSLTHSALPVARQLTQRRVRPHANADAKEFVSSETIR
jgi:hypothetical protein